MPPHRADRCSSKGAARLARIILAYWRARGFTTVSCRLERERNLWVVRGNLVSGLPPSDGAEATGPMCEELLFPLDDDRAAGRSLSTAPFWLGHLGSSLGRLAR